jgi:hypothetical protein
VLLIWQMKCILPRRKNIDTCHHASLTQHSLAEGTESLCIIRHVLFVHSAYIFGSAVHKLVIMQRRLIITPSLFVSPYITSEPHSPLLCSC